MSCTMLVDGFPFNTQAHEFTSEEEIVRVFSQVGVDLHLDDLYDNAGAYMGELVQRTTRQILSYLGHRYDVEALSQDARVREIATYMACYKLSKRRGNPELFEGDYMEGIEELERYREGTLYLPIPSNGHRASMTSTVIDNRFYMSQVRVIPSPFGSTYNYPGMKTYSWYAFYWL